MKCGLLTLHMANKKIRCFNFCEWLLTGEELIHKKGVYRGIVPTSSKCTEGGEKHWTGVIVVTVEVVSFVFQAFNQLQDNAVGDNISSVK